MYGSMQFQSSELHVLRIDDDFEAEVSVFLVRIDRENERQYSEVQIDDDQSPWCTACERSGCKHSLAVVWVLNTNARGA